MDMEELKIWQNVKNSTNRLPEIIPQIMYQSIFLTLTGYLKQNFSGNVLNVCFWSEMDFADHTSLMYELFGPWKPSEY